MIKDTTYNNTNVSINTKEISILKEHFPSCFKKDGSFDLERFKEELKDKVDIVHEGYELKFLGKSYAKLLASLDTTTVITPNLEHNTLSENKDSENIYISGDNLDGLKHLLKSYSKSVKCIYIDPPYNTGSDGFVYKDNFNFTVDELQDKLSVDETQAKRILDLTKRNSASHSAWLLFMYARLQLAKDLLKEDGVIFISIDDNEQANLKLLCNDVFGEENLIAQLVWKKKSGGGNDTGSVVVEHEYVLVFAKTNTTLNTVSMSESIINRYKYKDEKGRYSLDNLHKTAISGYDYSITAPNGDIIDYVFNTKIKGRTKPNWRCPINTFEKWKAEGLIDFKYDNLKGWIVLTKLYLSDTPTQKSTSILLDFGRTRSGKDELSQLFEGKPPFDYPKSTKLIKHFVELGAMNNDIILDFFSGSATTAHAVMQLNAEDGGNRKFISVQLPEVLDFKNPSQKNAFDFLKSIDKPTTLDYVGIERIIRASKKIQTEKPDLFNEEGKIKGDFGFKHFILNEPNQNTLDKCETFDKASLLGDATILDDFGTETVLTTWLNNDGYGLNPKVETIDLKGYTAYYCKKHLYLINPNFTQEAMVILFEKYDTIAGFNPENIVLFGYSFNEWSITEMLEKNLKILNDSEKNLKINIDVRY